MGLQEEIKQSEFRNERLKGIVNIIYTYGWMKNHLNGHLRPFEITMQQFNVLRILNGQFPSPISTSEIRSRMLDKMSDASRIVDRLNKKDLVIRTPNKSDRRLVDVIISEKGRKLIHAIDQCSKEMDNFIGALTVEEAQQLNALLDKIRDEYNPAV